MGIDVYSCTLDNDLNGVSLIYHKPV